MCIRDSIEGLELADQLHDAVKYIRGTYLEAEPPELGEREAIRAAIPEMCIRDRGICPGRKPGCAARR